MIVASELERRFEGEAKISYVNVEADGADSKLVEEIETRGLLYPVTTVDGVPVYDGAVSYPAIMRQVAEKLAQAEA